METLYSTILHLGSPAASGAFRLQTALLLRSVPDRIPETPLRKFPTPVLQVQMSQPLHRSLPDRFWLWKSLPHWQQCASLAVCTTIPGDKSPLPNTICCLADLHCGQWPVSDFSFQNEETHLPLRKNLYIHTDEILLFSRWDTLLHCGRLPQIQKQLWNPHIPAVQKILSHTHSQILQTSRC